jgi:formylglycine-generating enzyme required for sulfatase activity
MVSMARDCQSSREASDNGSHGARDVPIDASVDTHEAPPLAEVVERSNPFVALQGLWVQEHQVTRGEYLRYLGTLDGAARDAATPRFDWDQTGGALPVAFTTFDQATAFCAAIQAKLPTAAKWLLLAGKSWGIDPSGRGRGPLREWTSTLNGNLVRVLGIPAEKAKKNAPEQNVKDMRTPFYKSRSPRGATSRDLDPVSNEEIGFRCVREH